MNPIKQSADWIAWSLQFIFGLFVGAFLGVAIISRGRRFSSWWLASEQVSTFIFGAAIIGAGLASLYGDRLWLGSTYRALPQDKIKHSDKSRIVSIITGVLGGILVLTAILRHFGVF